MALTDNLLAHWKLEEASGTRDDAHTGNKDLTDNNTVTQAVGKQGNAASFEYSNNEYLSRTDSDFTLTGDFTFNAWIYPDSLSGANATYGANIVGQLPGSDVAGSWAVGVYSNGIILFRHWSVSGNDPNGVNKTSSTPVTDGSWQMITCRYSSGTYSIWHNGSSQTLGSTLSTESGWGTAGFTLGTFSTYNLNWDGRIDEASIWNRALSDAEIATLYNSGSGLAWPWAAGGGQPPRTMHQARMRRAG